MEVSVSGDRTTTRQQMRSTSNPSLHVVQHTSSHKNASNNSTIVGGSNGSIASLGDNSMGSVGSLSGSTSVPRSGIKMGTLLSPGNRSVAVNSHNNQRIRPIVRPLDPAELLGGVLGDQHVVAKLHQGGPKRSSSEVLTKIGYSDHHHHHRGDSKDMLSTNFGGLTVNDRSEEESDDSDEITSEESEWEQEVTPSGNVNYIVPFTTREAMSILQQNERISEPVRVDPQVYQQAAPATKQSGKNLSRMVRRRESKRDRNNIVGVGSGSNVVLKTPSGRTTAAVSQSLLLRKGSNTKRSSTVQESSDNDSSTYGQIKTFEAFFEASNLDESVTSVVNKSAATQQLPSQITNVTSDAAANIIDAENRDEVTEIHEVTLKFNSKQLKSQIPHFQMLLHGDNPANRGLLLENLLGIVPEAKPLTANEPFEILDNSVVVSDIIPNGPAEKCDGKVRAGDIIRSLDGHHVTIETANTYLLHKLSKASHSSSTGKVKLIIQRPIGPFLTSIVGDSTMSGGKNTDNLHANMDESTKREAILSQYTELTREQWRLILNSNVFALVISTSAVSQNAPDQEADLMFQFPNDERLAPQNIMSQDHKDVLPPIVRARGIFSTLMQLLPDVVHSVPLTSSILMEGTSKTQDQVLIHVAYVKENDEILLLGLPGAIISEFSTKNIVQEVSRLILLKYGSLAKAALGSTSELDNLIGLIVHDVLTKGSASEWIEFESDQWLKLPEDIQFQVEDAMNQFESSDFTEFSDDLYDYPREFTILGCVLFHRAKMVASHLSKEDLRDVRLWLKHENVLSMTQKHPVHKLVIWHELYSRNSFQERRFLLVTGLGYQLLGVILETGGCTAEASDIVKPDPFYVDQALNTLEHLAEMGIPLVCEKWLSLPNNPPLMDIDEIFTTAAKAKKLDIASGTENLSIAPAAEVVLKRTKSLDFSGCSSGSERSTSPRHRRDRSDDTHSSYEMSTAFRGEDKEDASSNWELPRNGRRSYTNLVPASGDEVNRKASMRSSGSGAVSTTFSSSSFTSTGTKSDEVVTYNISNLTLSLHNTLIYYVHLDQGDGVILTPHLKDSTKSGQLRKILIENFKNSVQIIHATLQCCTSHRENMRKSSSASVGGQENDNPWINKSLVPVKEQGMLFRWSPIETLPVFSYWVCGRVVLTPEPKECYVAYHESAPQQLVELAFRLTFGLHL